MASVGSVKTATDSLGPLARFDSLDDWMTALARPSALKELAALVACALLAWLVVRAISRVRRVNDASSVLFGERIFDGALFPLLLLAFAYAAQAF